MSSKWTRRLAVSVVAGGAVVAFAAPSLGDTTRIKAVKRDGKFVWNKDFVSINKGDKVVWRNPTNRRHTVTFYEGATKDTTIGPGERTSKKFKTRGAKYYRCTLHSELNDGECTGMCGHVHVN
ncbi:MAG TPA: plastocyanin/azurin family copper-binding protein [Actinomycetota bacterium]|nr:plastocyanin/azurin family copper-binding protein [Actinomycetota bacterium]